MESLKKEFSEKEESKRENLAQLNQVISLFKESIDKVFDRASAFTFEKYKEENDDEQNYREFEEIKKMVLYFRDRNLYCLDWYELSQEQIQTYRDLIDYDNELLQLEFSLKNLSRLKGFKESNNGIYQSDLNDKAFQNNLRKWRDLRNTPIETNKREFEEIKDRGSFSALFENVRSIIAEQLNVDAAQVTPEAEFVKDLGTDSLDVVELIMALEEKFGIEIPDEQAEKIVNVGDVVRYIENNTLI